jgi:hypothetical protein
LSEVYGIKNSDDMPYRLWGGDEEVTTGLKCLFTPQCKFCHVGMEYWQSVPQRFSINDGTGETNSHALDVLMWCPKCGHLNLFGVAVSKEHYEFIQRRVNFLPKRSFHVSKKDIIEAGGEVDENLQHIRA